MNIELDFLRTYWINDYGLHRNKLVIWIQMAGTRSIQTSEYLKNRFFSLQISITKKLKIIVSMGRFNLYVLYFITKDCLTCICVFLIHIHEEFEE